MNPGGGRPGEVLLMVPPFHGLERPSLAVHLLQAVAARAGLSVRILYANLLLARRLGEMVYEDLCYQPEAGGALPTWERLFAPLVFGPSHALEAAPLRLPPGLEEAPLREQLLSWLEEIASTVAQMGVPVVGCTSTFALLPSIALLSAIKRAAPGTMTLLGGANCEGEMAEGLRVFSAQVDYIFSGESEQSFLGFLSQLRDGALPSHPVIHGQPCEALDELPPPDYREYYEQFTASFEQSQLREERRLIIPYETSRGCWWGQKHHCTFCGLNGQGMKHRKKSPGKVLADLRVLLDKGHSRLIQMTDNIMPWEYFSTLLPALARADLGASFFYEQKANLTLRHLGLLGRAGVRFIQPGIESLSSTLLKKMDKGVTPRQNLALLRYALAENIRVEWNVLVGFPGDSSADYEGMIRLLPLLHHLQPPAGYSVVSFDRFSPYFHSPTRYGIRNLRPNALYDGIYPQGFPVEKIASHFTGDYNSVLTQSPETVQALAKELQAWRLAWRSRDIAPMLVVSELGEDTYLLLDTRGLPGLPQVQVLDTAQAAAALTEPHARDEAVEWGLAHKVCVEHEGRILPLATAAPRLLQAFESRQRPSC